MKTNFIPLLFVTSTLLSLTLFINSCQKDPIVDLEPEVISTDISITRTLADRSTGVDYRIDGCIDVSGSAVLTIESGVVVEFTQNSCLNVSDFAVLKAVGTANKPIIFTGQQKTKGFWQGISFFETNNTENELTYCTIEYAGTAAVSTASDARQAALIVGKQYKDPARLKMNNVTIQHNLNTGLYLYSDSFIDAMKGCTFTDNEEPILVNGEAIHYLDADNSFTGNLKDHVLWLFSSSSSTANANFTVKELPVPYYLGSDTYAIKAGGNMAINNGATLIVKAGAKLYCTEGGIITMNGTAAKPIVIKGESPQAGYWDGIYASNSAKLTMNYVHLSDGGEASTNKKAMATHLSDGELNVTNCVFSNYSIYGLSYDPDMPHNADISTSNTCTGTTGAGCIWEL